MKVVLIFCYISVVAFAELNTAIFRRDQAGDEGCPELSTLTTVRALSRIQCCILCRQNPSCKSVVYNTIAMGCSLCSTSYENDKVGLHAWSNSVIYFYMLESGGENEHSLQLPIDCNVDLLPSEINLTVWKQYHCSFYLFVPDPMKLNKAALYRYIGAAEAPNHGFLVVLTPVSPLHPYRASSCSSLLGKHCYRLNNGLAHILIVESAEENEFVRRMVFENQPEHESIFLGMTYDHESKLRSSEGVVTLNYTNWESNFTPMASKRVAMTRYGTWKLLPADQERPFVCKI